MSQSLHQQVLLHFKTHDPVLYNLAQRYSSDKIVPEVIKKDYFRDLCREIVGQQLSTKAASTIFSRFESLFPETLIRPDILRTLPDETLRSVGLSRSKSLYIKTLAEAVTTKQILLSQLDALPDEEVITQLTSLKGIGRWTAEMFLMFTLQRPDVFSVGDLGLKRAIERHYNVINPTPDHMLQLAESWQPYRTYACRVLWQSLDNNPTI